MDLGDSGGIAMGANKAFTDIVQKFFIHFQSHRESRGIGQVGNGVTFVPATDECGGFPRG